jgi:hypothetical protein
MSFRQLSHLALAGLAVGCASYKPATSPTPTPEAPKAMVYATYYGGMLNRQTEAVFKVDEGAYVMVGHLGGDGRLSVLYPEDGRESGRVSGDKWFRTRSIAAYYDAAPQLYSFAMSTYRSFGAQLDSYDGRGYGYVFIVASKRPLDFDKISEFGLWNDMVLADYRQSSDPRLFINQVAQYLAGDHAYTLKFARSTSTFAATSYSDQLFDCALLSELGFAYYYLNPFSYGSFFTPSVAFPGARGGCGGGYADRYAFFRQRPIVFASSTPAAAPPSTPTATPAPKTGGFRPRRPGFDNPRSGFGFASPARGASPENASRAPRDYSWRRYQFADPTTRSGGFGGSARRRNVAPPAGMTSSGSSGSTTQSAPVRAPEHKPVIERAAPASSPRAQQTQKPAQPKGDQKSQ